MKVLLFGGTGIISKEICNLAIARGDSVSIFNRGQHETNAINNATSIRGDFRKEDIQSIIEKLDDHYDVIVDFLSYTETEIEKMIGIAGGRCEHFVYISSATVYSDTNGFIDENYPANNDTWSYASFKKECEKKLIETSQIRNYTIIRPYITYGQTRIPNQFSPIEYYTVINRIKHGKPVLLSAEEIETTITHSKDFAKGAYALFCNKQAYGEIFNIVGSYRTSWSNILEVLCRQLNLEPEIIRIPIRYLKENAESARFNVYEIIGDKGRRMLFDNSKIIKVAPYLNSSISYDEAVPEIVDYFSLKEHQIINYSWDAAIDDFIEQYCLR